MNPRAVNLIVSAALLGSAASAQTPVPRLVVPAADSSVAAPEGHLLVQWELDGELPPGSRFELMTSRDSTFAGAAIISAEQDFASMVSGLPDGNTYVTVRLVGGDNGAGAWSEPGTIAVAYPARSLVTRLMLLGSVTLVVLVSVILFGHYRTRGESGAR